MVAAQAKGGITAVPCFKGAVARSFSAISQKDLTFDGAWVGDAEHDMADALTDQLHS